MLGFNSVLDRTQLLWPHTQMELQEWLCQCLNAWICGAGTGIIPIYQAKKRTTCSTSMEFSHIWTMGVVHKTE